jgi:hypothetical protein
MFRGGRPIVVVSGLPRSGTSMAMRMLEAGGVAILSDGVRRADDDNPLGYYELEAVKDLDKNGDTSWLDDAGGKAVKIISLLLTWLPETHDYRVLFMRRDLGEVVASQQKMLAARGEAPASDDTQRTQELYERHLAEITRFLGRRKCFSTLLVEHRRVLDQPQDEALRISRFLDQELNVAAMAAAVDPRLHRNRR